MSYPLVNHAPSHLNMLTSTPPTPLRAIRLTQNRALCNQFITRSTGGSDSVGCEQYYHL
jgi:hypothetical protein